MSSNRREEEKEAVSVKDNEYEQTVRTMTSLADADRLSALLEEDARRYDRSFSDDREAGRL